jgi:hypothetical protein
MGKKHICKFLIIVLTLISTSCSAQWWGDFQRIDQVPTIESLKGYQQTANRLHVFATNEDYILCPSCVVNGTTVLQGYAFRKWKLHNLPKVDSIAKNTTGDSTIFWISGRRHAVLDSVGHYTDSMARHAFSLTTIGTSGASTYDPVTGIANVPNYTFTETYLGTVTSVNASISGALGVTGGPVTSSGTLVFAWQGTTSQYVRGDGSLATFPSSSVYVDSLWRVVGKDSIFYSKNGITYAIKDSTGGPLYRFGKAGEDATAGENRIFAAGTNYVRISGSVTSAIGAQFNAYTTSSGTGIYGASFSGYGIEANALGTSAIPLLISGSMASSSVSKMIEIKNTSSGSSNGFGSKITFNLSTALGNDLQLSNDLISKWTDATSVSRTSQFIITGVNSGTTHDIFYHYGNGNAEIPVAGSGMIFKSPDGTIRKSLTIDNSGAAVWTAL